MKLVVLGLSLSSSWGNGHATTFRALLRAFAARGHDVLFLERDVPWYAQNRDLADPGYCDLRFYGSLADLGRFEGEVAGADAVIVGSYVPEGVAVGAWAMETASGPVAFYDIDTPVTLAKLGRADFEYLDPGLIRRYDLYLSFTGGPTLRHLEDHYGSPAARALYCSVDESVYGPTGTPVRYDLGYLGTYSDDRQPTLDALLLEPARRHPERRFIVAGPGYPAGIDWPANVERIDHLPPSGHPDFYSACRFTLNVTRADMIRAGHSPSVRIFEAAACGTPIISDRWEGLDELLSDGSQIRIADGPEDVLAALALPAETRDAIAAAARARVLGEHTAAHRAAELETHLAEAIARGATSARGRPKAYAPARRSAAQGLETAR